MPYHGQTLGMVVTDLSDQKRQQAADVERARAIHRLLLERTLSAQEEERRRIARELHDESGQLLTALLVGLRALEDAQSLAVVGALGQRLRAIAAQAIGEVGRLARGLHPAVLEDLGLQSMRERAAMLGGTVSFGSRRQGATVLVQLPLASQDAQPGRPRST